MQTRIREAVCSVQTHETPTTPPILLTTDPLIRIAFGSKQGNLHIVTLPFSDGKHVQGHTEHIPIETDDQLTVNTLFLDMENAPAIISLHRAESLLLATRKGGIWSLKKTRRRIALLDREIQGILPIAEGIIVSSGLRLFLLSRQGAVKDTLSLKAEALAAPLWLEERGLLIVPTEQGVEAVSVFRGVLVRKWSYASAAVHATPTAHAVREGIILITFGSHDGMLHALTPDGSLVWQYKTQGSILGTPRMDDLNGDGIIDIAFGSTDDTLYVVDEYGVREWAYETDFWITARPAVYDIDADGLKELFVGGYDGTLYTFSPQPDYVPAVNVAAASMLQQAVLVADEAHESVAGYFAKVIARDALEGMILFTEAFALSERQGLIIALTHTGLVYAKRFTRDLTG